MLHHKIEDFFVFGPPFLLILCVVEITLLFCCLGDVGRVHRILREDDGWRFEFSHHKCGEQVVVLEAVCNVFQESLNVEVEGGRRLGGHCVFKDDEFQPPEWALQTLAFLG